MNDISIDVLNLFILFGVGFLAAIIDSVVGGGGLITIPTLLLTGLPLPTVLGTNKLAASMSTLTSTISFIRSGKINFNLIKYLIPFSLIGAILGSITVLHVPTSFLKPLIIFLLLVVTIFTIFKKNFGSNSTYSGMTRETGIISAFAAFILGFYDGFFGAGTGSFLIFAFLFLGFDFISAAGNARALNFFSNIASLFTFICLNSVNYIYGLVMGIAMIAGAFVGSKIAIKQGVSYIRPLFIGVTIILLFKQVWDLL